MKLSVNSCNLIAVSVNVETDDGCKMKVPVLYDANNGDVFFLGDNIWDMGEFSAAIKEYLAGMTQESLNPVNEQTWANILVLKALAKPPEKK